MYPSKIPWTEYAVNWIHGCRSVDASCANCWAAGIAHRITAGRTVTSPLSHFCTTVTKGGRETAGPVTWNGERRFYTDDLVRMIRGQKPGIVFMSSRSEPFDTYPAPFRFPAVTCRCDKGKPTQGSVYQVNWLDLAFTAMHLRPDCLFLLLTKRPDGMARYLAQWPRSVRRTAQVFHVLAEKLNSGDLHVLGTEIEAGGHGYYRQLPSNLMIGVSVWNQATYERAETLLDVIPVPRQRRWVSAEPLLGLIHVPKSRRPAFGWLVAGGESASRARPVQMQWFRELKRELTDRWSVPFLLKQVGTVQARGLGLQSRSGADRKEWPAEFRTRTYRALPDTITKHWANRGFGPRNGFGWYGEFLRVERKRG